MRILLVVAGLLLLGACAAPRTYIRETPYPLVDAFACALEQMRSMDYQIVLADSVGGALQGRREITGIREAARGGRGTTSLPSGSIPGSIPSATPWRRRLAF